MTVSDSVVFRAEVRPSQRSNDPSHQPWVATNKDGVVLAGHCTCMPGLGEYCSHIAAVLFKIEARVRLGLTTLASTSKPCKWNNLFTMKVEPARIRDIKLYGEKAVARVAANGRKRRKTFDLVSSTDVEQKAFLQSLLEEEPTPVALSFFVETAKVFRCKRVVKQTVALPQPLRALFREDNLTLSEEELNTRCTEVADKLTITPEQTDFVESQTRAQSKSIV